MSESEAKKPTGPRAELQEILNAWYHMMPPALLIKFEAFNDKHFPAPSAFKPVENWPASK